MVVPLINLHQFKINIFKEITSITCLGKQIRNGNQKIVFLLKFHK